MAQPFPLSCSAQAGPSQLIRWNEITATVGDVIVKCWSGTPTAVGAPVPVVDFQIYFNADVTVRTAGPTAEVLLLVDDPAPQNQQPCTGDPLSCGWTGGAQGANVFRGKVLGRNAIAFQGIPLDPPGDGKSRTFRMTNLRVDASSLELAVLSGGRVQASVTMAGPVNMYNTLEVGHSDRMLNTAVLDATGSIPLDKLGGVGITNCTSVPQKAAAALQFTARMGPTFRRRTQAAYVDTETSPPPAAQNVPGVSYGTESMFFAPAFPAVNGLNKAGLADFGTRLRAIFSDLPAGVTIYVSTVPVTYTAGSPAVNGPGQFQARLVASETGAFAPAAATTTIGGIPVAALAVNQGTSVAAWEVLSSSGAAGEKAQFAVWVSFTADGASSGTGTVRLQLGPVSNVRSADDVAAIPRFLDDGTTFLFIRVLPSCPGPEYVVEPISSSSYSVEVDGVAINRWTSFNWQPGSTHTLKAILPAASSDGTSRTIVTWSDGGAPTHTITVPVTSTTYRAIFGTQYQLALAANPGEGGRIVATPASADGYYAASVNSKVQLEAVPNPGYTFLGFEEDLTGTQNPQTVTMKAPAKVTAVFTKTGLAPVGVSVTPTYSFGGGVALKATFQAAQTYKTIQSVQVLAAVAPDGGGAPFCFVHYDAVGGALWLYSDIYGFFQGPVKPGVASADLQGSDCGLNTQESSVQASGQTLELSLKLLSKVKGDRNLYLRAMETDSTDTGWIRRGTWNQPGPPISQFNVYPSFGARSNEGFSLRFGELYGLDGFDKGWMQFLVAADSTGGGLPFCFVHYDRAGHQLWMYSSDVGFFLGPIAPGTASTQLDSSACQVDTGSSVVTPQGSSVQLSLPVTMKAPMSGLKKLYMRALDALGVDSGWQQVGTYQVP